MPMRVSNANKLYSPASADVLLYNKAELRLAKRPKLWSENSPRLERFFDTGYPVVTDKPREFVEFCEVYADVRQAAAKVGIEEDLTERMLQALARNLYYGATRQKFYVRFLEGRIERSDTKPEVSSMIEIEERYQYYLYRKECHHKGRGIGPKFSTWKEKGGCPVTFYSIMSH